MITSDTTATALLSAEYAISTERISAADAAMTRHSVRSYLDIPVSDDELHSLLALTSRAPSAFNLQPWRFIVVRDQAVKDALKDAAYGQKQVGQAPVVIALYADMDDTLANLSEVVHTDLTPEKRASTIAMLEKNFGGMTPEARANWANGQTNIALGYLLLIAKAEGFDTSPMLGFESDRVKAILGIPATATITAIVALGRGADDGFRSHRHAVERTTTFR
ncbi:nitroreductase family protein [Gemmatimonas sp.]|uniref:nitroreductase family protein n=1 Tax=Gemmatimonas sp. TaxID=1962908 RepID=UPI0035676784